MADTRAVDEMPDFESASRLLLRRIAAVSERMTAAEPGTDDFLDAYVEVRDLKRLYRTIRGTWQVPAEFWAGIGESSRQRAA